MRHEKIIKREDGTRFNISVVIVPSFSSISDIGYKVGLLFKPKGARLWRKIPHSMVDCVSKEEIYEAKLEAWQKLKPEL